MENSFSIDSHKLIFHVERVNNWLKGKTISPIYLEITPSGACNHRCIFCALDYLKYKADFLNLKVLKASIKQAALSGVKSIMYAGEGEPLLHKDICEIVQHTKNSGIDTAVTTNGVLFTKETAQKLLKYTCWIRVSLNAGKSKTYALIHRTREKDFYTVLKNLEEAVKIKNKNKLKTTLGVQFLLIPENVKEVYTLTKLLKNIGVDYLTIKPYSQHPLSASHINASFNYNKYSYMGKKLLDMQNKHFKIIFREQTMKKLTVDRDYKHCLGLPFWSYITAQGDVYACSAFLGKKDFCCGNIYKDSFRKIMNGRRRKIILNKAASKLDVSKCRKVCRLDKINSYLWALKHPPAHTNFI